MANVQKPAIAADAQSSKTGGAFTVTPSVFRNWIRADNSTPFAPELDRYHLYVSYACPFACRTLAVRALKGLEHVISISPVHYHMTSDGWQFNDEEGCPDHLYGSKLLREIYKRVEPSYAGRVTVPVLWDKKLNTIVNNESPEIIRMLNSEFNAFAKNPTLDLYPAPLQAQIDETNTLVQNNVNTGVYKCGFATAQAPYEEAFNNLFNTLDKLEDILSKQRYLVGSTFTEADVRLFTTLVRFDPVYVCHFKCNKKRLVDYPNLHAYACDIYQMPGIKDTCDMKTIKDHYYFSHRHINPHGIIPLGPEVDFSKPHNRDAL